MYAVIESGGKQYKVKEGEKIIVEKIDVPVGNEIQLDKVLLASKENEALLDKSALEKVKVVGEVIKQGKGKKIIVFKKKRRKDYKKTKGHRQYYTQIEIKQIIIN
ncbi:50S ribosomal protein L21 [bacterium]|nr:50S ribosomal protein L21 [bacterium]